MREEFHSRTLSLWDFGSSHSEFCAWRFGIDAECDCKISEGKLFCPECGEEVWDKAFGHKLAKCWNCKTAFDTMDD